MFVCMSVSRERVAQSAALHSMNGPALFFVPSPVSFSFSWRLPPKAKGSTFFFLNEKLECNIIRGKDGAERERKVNRER